LHQRGTFFEVESFKKLLFAMNSKLSFVLAFSAVVAFSLVDGMKIESLPDYTGPELSQSAGYIELDPTTGKSYFYWLIESQSDPVNDPLIVWYQGGPGCSGLLGLFTEMGPLRPNLMGGIEYNNISWTNFANVLFVEQPTGVGFSYSNTSTDYNSNDTSAALDNFAFLELFLEENPSYQGRSTWISGESYGGVYIPTLTSVIINHTSSMIANQLVGLTIGNPVISCESADYNSIQMDLFYWHALVSQIVYNNWTSNGCREDSSGDFCNDVLSTAVNQIGVIFQQKRDVEDKMRAKQVVDQPSLDPDDLYQDFCTGNGTLEFSVNQGYPNACMPVGIAVMDYLNRKDVQSAIGAKPMVWNECAGGNFNYTSLGNSMIPNYKYFFEARPDIDILIYSGDVDIATVPFGITHACLSELHEVPTQVWGPWFVNGATAGYVEAFEHYTYATLKGAGHECPQYQPLTSYELILRFTTAGNLNKGGPAASNGQRRTQGKVLKEYGIRG